MSFLNKLKGKKSEEADDGGYKFSLSTGLQKRSASEKEEDQYLAEQESKELSERRIIQNRITKQGLKDVGKAAAGAAFSGLVTIGEGAVATGRYAGSTQIAQYAGTKAKGALSYIPEKFEKARLDYEAGKISQKKYDEAYRQHKIDTANIRGEATEQRHYREKVGRQTEKQRREEAKKDIEISAEKEYRKERAKAMGRLEVAQLKAVRQGTQTQQFGVPPQRPRRQWIRPNFNNGTWKQPTASQLDPMGIYTLGGYQQQQTIPNARFDPTHLNRMLGYNPQARQVQPQQQPIQTQQRPQQSPIRADTSAFFNSMLSLNAPRQEKHVKPISIGEKKNGNGKRKPHYNMFTGIWED